jgi:hypothetical protein
MAVVNMLDISTAHVTSSTNDWLMTAGTNHNFIVYPTEYGWLIPVMHYQEEIHITNIPRDLIAVLYYAKGLGCEWIHLDRDAEYDKELPSYEW